MTGRSTKTNVHSGELKIAMASVQYPSRLNSNLHSSGCSCSAAIEHLPRDDEVEGSNPAGHLAFFFSNFPSYHDVLNQVPQGMNEVKLK